MMKIGQTSHWLLVTISGRGPKGGYVYERRVFRHGQRIESRKRSYSFVAEISVNQLRRCVCAHRYVYHPHRA